MASPETLHEALANLGITSAKDKRSKWNTRSLYMFGEFIGDYEAHAAWELVNDLRYGVWDDPRRLLPMARRNEGRETWKSVTPHNAGTAT